MTMTLDKAIKILHEDLGAPIYDEHPGLYQAQKLSIEALAVIKFNRQSSNFNYYVQLPGETKE